MKRPNTLAKIISAALLLCMMLSFVSCDAIKGIFGGSLKLESFTVDRSSVKTSYFIGEEIDFSGIRATVKYSDSELNAELTKDDLTITYADDITATVGQKDVKVSFQDPHLDVEQSTTVQITVTEDPNVVKHESYKLNTSSLKTNYEIGETIDLTGLKLYEVMSDKSEVEVTDLAGLVYSVDLATVTATAGNKTVTVTYNGEAVTGTIVFRVTDPEATDPVTGIVASGSYKTNYEVGETIDLTGLTVTVTYKESGERVLTTGFTADSVDMSTAGDKEVKVNFVDPIHENDEFVYITIKVVKRDKVMQFAAPEGISSFNTANKNAGTLNYGDVGFQGQFAKGGKTYMIGDDNDFVFVPAMTVNVNNVPTPLAKYYTVVEIYVGGVKLDSTNNSETSVTYTLNGETIVTVDTYNGKYDFAKPVDNVKISVLPSPEHYKNDSNFPAVVLEAKVIDAYNVYTAKELSVIENYNGVSWGRDPADNPEWASINWETFKAENGLAGINPAGVVLHNNISITYEDVPSSFFHKYDGEIVYENANGDTDADGNVITKNFHGYYLKDHSILYYHSGSADFVIEGNFFQIDADGFPIIASPSIFGDGRDYGSDYSNSCLFMFQTVDDNWVGDESVLDVSNVSINNLSLRGNAGRDGWVIKQAGNTIGTEGELVTAGGLIMLKSTRHSETVLDNVNSNSFFITYFPDYQGHLTVKNSKCYDSYQNAAFVWADTVLTVEDSFINGTGGPAVIAQSVKEDSIYYNPIANFNNTVIETHVTGQEIWFNAVGATALVPQITALSTAVNAMLDTAAGVKGGWVDSTGNMNIKAILMPRGNSTEALQDAMIQGTVVTDGNGIERWYDTTNENFNMDWATILQHSAFAAAAPFITVHDSEGTAHTLYFVQQGTSGTFYDISNKALGTDASHTAIIQAFAAADEIILHQGGLSVLFEMYH